jgi:hypothetical protein
MGVQPAIDLDRLLKLRVAVARVGEGDSDRPGWWNTRGQLGRTGAAALRRGFPRTHYFAQARAVLAVAAARCAEVFDPPDCVTLWRLDAATEEAFDTRWEFWLDHAGDWTPFFQAIAALPATGTDLVAALTKLELVDDAATARLAKLKRTGNSVQLPGFYAATDADVMALALGFARSEPGDVAVPYARRSGA